MSEFYDIVIIGAGICGLTAAVELSQNKSLKILVLEADREPGGRVKSVTLDNGMVIDSGAHWFHGGDANPFYYWVKARYDLGTVVMDTTENTHTFWRYGDTRVMQEVSARLEDEYLKYGRDSDLSLRDFALRLNDPAVTDVIKYVTSEWMAIDNPEDARASEFFDDPLGYDGWQVIGGLGKITAMMEDEARINGVTFSYETKVSRVGNDGKNLQIISDNHEVITVAQCLVTVSCEILKHKDIVFDSGTQAQIDEKTAYLHMGNLAKITVPLHEDFFEKNSIRSDTSYDLIDKKLYIHARSGGEASLTIFVGGTRSEEIETMDEETAEDFIATVLSDIESLKDFQPFRDGKIFKSVWRRSPLAKGSYAIGRPGGKRSDPFAVNGVVFAGEAFVSDAKDSPGQMAGAFVSAQRALKLLL